MNQTQNQYECPDCHPDTKLEDMGGNVYVLRVYHDSTCPTFAGLNARRNK